MFLRHNFRIYIFFLLWWEGACQNELLLALNSRITPVGIQETIRGPGIESGSTLCRILYYLSGHILYIFVVLENFSYFTDDLKVSSMSRQDLITQRTAIEYVHWPNRLKLFHFRWCDSDRFWNLGLLQEGLQDYGRQNPSRWIMRVGERRGRDQAFLQCGNGYLKNNIVIKW